MPRRCTELLQLPMPVKKKIKPVEESCQSLDVSFTDDEALPPGIIFTDIKQKQWRIGRPVGRGSFGRIYLASDDIQEEVTKLNARYVVKIEPHSNGPLFVEIHCLIRTAQVAKVREWRYQNKQKRLGMPVYIASGSLTDEKTGTKYRFLVLPRYDIDLQKIITRIRVLDVKNVLILALQIIDVLEFLHNNGYTHSDIKSSNLMLGFDGAKVDKITTAKSTSSFQKETKTITMLTGRRPKPVKGRTSNYYDDEDFIVKNKSHINEDNDERLANVKKKLRKILSDKDSRKLHRHHAFNLRQISNYVNYEDLNSSVCSDRSYQRLLDDYGNKSFNNTADDCLHNEIADVNIMHLYKEAITSQSNKQIYLLDYGLASKFLDSEGKHKDFVMDARKAHDGTLEYSSRDSHLGAHSRRSDLETLGYNMLDWLTGHLPWKTTEILADPDLVHAVKKNFMSNIKQLLKTCFKTEFYPQFIEKYFQYVTSLDFKEKPDYNYCRSLFRTELVKNGYISNYNKEIYVNFTEPPMSAIGRRLNYSKRFNKKNTPLNFSVKNGINKSYERENLCTSGINFKLELLKQTLNSSSDGFRKPCVSRNFFISDADLIARLKKSLMPHDIFGKKLSPKNLRSKKKVIQKRKGMRRLNNNMGKFGNFMGSARQFTWAEILAGNPEDIIRKEKTATVDDFDDETCKYRIRKLSNASDNSDSSQSPLLQKDYLAGVTLTYAMKEVIANFNKAVSGKCIKEQVHDNEDFKGYTPAMKKVYKLKLKHEAKEKFEAQKQNKCEYVPMRCTRSMTIKATPKPVVTEMRVTRLKASIDSNPELNKENKLTSKSKKKVTKDESNKTKSVEIVVESSPKKIKKTSLRRYTVIPNNRRRLRSSKRNKNVAIISLS